MSRCHVSVFGAIRDCLADCLALLRTTGLADVEFDLESPTASRMINPVPD